MTCGATIPGFVWRGDGRTRVNDAAGYQILYQARIGGRTTYGRRVLVVPDVEDGPPPREGIDLDLRAARSVAVPNIDSVGRNGALKLPLTLLPLRHGAALMAEVTFDHFAAVDIRVGRIVEVEEFPEARKPGVEAARRLRAGARREALVGADPPVLARGARGPARRRGGQLPAAPDRAGALRGARARAPTATRASCSSARSPAPCRASGSARAPRARARRGRPAGVAVSAGGCDGRRRAAPERRRLGGRRAPAGGRGGGGRRGLRRGRRRQAPRRGAARRRRAARRREPAAARRRRRRRPAGVTAPGCWGGSAAES